MEVSDCENTLAYYTAVLLAGVESVKVTNIIMHNKADIA
jgi:hypothetical protein